MPHPSAPPSPFTLLKPHTAPSIKRLLDDLRDAINRTASLDFPARMERNHSFRNTYWEHQDWSGTKRCPPGTDPRKIFPWDGASDSRVPIVEEIILERVDQAMVAYDLARLRIGPRDMSPDQEKQNKAALWGQVASYYQDECAGEMRSAVQQWIDIGEEYGHSMLYTGWKEELQLEQRSISAQDLLQMITTATLQLAEQQAAQEAAGQQLEIPEGQETFLSPEQQETIGTAVAADFQQTLQERTLTGKLIETLIEYDPDMPLSEARRVAAGLQSKGASTYYAPYIHTSRPEWRALQPMIDFLIPPETAPGREPAWFMMPEWVTEVELTSRIQTEGYNKEWCDKVLEHKGRAWNALLLASSSASNFPWLLSSGYVGSAPAQDEQAPLYQILHVYYRATCIAGVPALYHTILHPGDEERAGYHECCEHAHGRYPIQSYVREPAAKTLMESRGIGEVSFSSQREIKLQRDMRADNASMQLMPPAEVPARQAGGRVDLRPGRQIPRTTTGGQGGINWLKPPGDTRSSKEVETDIITSLNAYWGRGALVDPEVKLTRLRARIKHVLTNLREAWKLTFQLVQQFAPEEIRAACVGGLPVNLTTTRAEIQGQISLSIDFDPADMDMEMVLKKLKILNEGLLPLDRTGSLNTHNILRAAVGALMPGWVQEVMPNTPEQTLQSEMEDEDRIFGQLLLGLEQPYILGKDHKARREVLLQRINASNADGTPTKVRRTLETEPDIAALVENRIKFHDQQLAQQQNANTGRIGVEPQQQAEPAA